MPSSAGGGTLVSGPSPAQNVAPSPRAEVAVAPTDARSTESATAVPAMPRRASSRTSLYVALALVAIGAPATYFALHAANKSSTEGATTTNDSSAHAMSSASASSLAATSATTTAKSSESASAPVAASVALAVICPLPNARVTFRGRTSALPFTEIVTPGTQTESIEVTAEGHEGRRYFVRIDHAMSLAAKLPVGKAIVVDATAAETSAALGGGTLEVAKPTGGAPIATAAPPTTTTSKPTVDISLDR
jgi:hypothetical protein